MGDGYGKLFLLLAAIAIIFIAASGKGRQIYEILTDKSTETASTQNGTPSVPNPTDLRGGIMA